jgi:CheY-like chemotaxis protein
MSRILLREDNEMNRDMLSRRLECKGFTVLMAVTGHAMCRDHEKSINTGCDDYAAKPVIFNELLEQINRLHKI